MQVILQAVHYGRWLDKASDENALYPLLDNLAYCDMTITPVSDWVNNQQHGNASYIAPNGYLEKLHLDKPRTNSVLYQSTIYPFILSLPKEACRSIKARFFKAHPKAYGAATASTPYHIQNYP